MGINKEQLMKIMGNSGKNIGKIKSIIGSGLVQLVFSNYSKQKQLGCMGACKHQVRP